MIYGGEIMINRKHLGSVASSLGVVWACLWSGGAYAQAGFDDSMMSESLYFEEIPMVMTATRLRQTRTQTPVSVTVIDRAQIEASGFVEIVDLLRLVPGFQVAHSGARIFTATYHGQAGQFPTRLQVLIDGRSVYLPLLSSVDWSMLGVQMDDIERIEVIRGPNSPAYGANAFLGTINIITREPVSEYGQFIALRMGDPGLRNISLRHSGQVADLDYRISLGYRENSGFKSIYDDVAVSAFNFRGTYYASVEDEIDIHLGFEQGVNDVTGVGDAFAPDHERNSSSSFEKIRWRHVLSSESDINVQFYHNRYTQNDEYQVGMLSDVFTALDGANFTDALGGSVPAALAFLGLNKEDDQMINFSIYDGTANRYDLEIQHLILFSGGHQLAWGIGTRLDQLESEYYLGQNDLVQDTSSRAFFNGQYLLTEDWIVNAGLMAEVGDLVDTQFSPRLALNWSFSKGHVLRVSSTQAHRTPSLLDANWDWAARTADGQVLNQRFITQNELESEKIRSYELGYAGELPQQSSFIEIKLFREEIRDNIGTRRDDSFSGDSIDGEALLVGNNGQSNINGIEGQLSYRPSKRNFVNFQFSIAKTAAEQLRRAASPTPKDVSEATPTRTASLLGAYGLSRNVDVSAGIYHVSEMEWLGDGNAIPAYTRVDARIAKGITVLGQESQLALVVQNMGDSYKDFFHENEFETRSYLKFTMLVQ